MQIWNRKRYEEEKNRFIRQRIGLSPLWSQFTLIFAVSWGAAWFSSWVLLRFFAPSHEWVRSLPLRYSAVFVIAYLCFFIAVRVWIDIVRREPQQQGDSFGFPDATIGGGDAEGCLIVIAVTMIGFVVGGLFYFAGGAPMLLEAAFESAFAGVVVRRLSGDFTLGDWKLRLFANTWKPALFCFVVLIMIAVWLQHQAPDANTFAEAVRALLNNLK